MKKIATIFVSFLVTCVIIISLTFLFTKVLVATKAIASSCPSGEIANYTCPFGFTLSSDNTTCNAQPTCPGNSTYNAAQNDCEETPASVANGTAPQCQPGWNYNQATNTCDVPAVCPDNSTLQNGQCQILPTVTCSSGSGGFNLSGDYCFQGDSNDNVTAAQQCISTSSGYLCPIGMQQCNADYTTPICPNSGTLNTSLNECTANPSFTCPSGYTQTSTNCKILGTCPNGGSFESSTDSCEMPACPSGSTYNASMGECVTGATQGFANGQTCAGQNYFEYCLQLSNGNIMFSFISNDWISLTSGGEVSSSSYSLWWKAGVSNNQIYLQDDYDFGGSTYGSVPLSGGDTGWVMWGWAWGDSYIDIQIQNGQIRINNYFNNGNGYTYTNYGNWTPLYATTCPSGFTLSNNQCVQPPYCPSGWTLYGGICTQPPTCPSSTTLGSGGECTMNLEAICPAGYNYNSSNNLCEATPQCSSGSYNSSSGQCLTGYSCPADSNDACLPYNGSYYCSPNPCVNMSNSNNTQVTQGNMTSYTNNGQYSSSGQCLGQIFIFNGKPMECADRMYEDTNCCKGGYTKQGKVLMVIPMCDKEDALTDEDVASGLCQSIGSYCAIKVPLIGLCLERKEVYCCFNSLLGRIIQQQGRPQLADFGYLGDWGTPTNPNCRGFTPTEFQMIDFDKINLSEYFGQVEQTLATQEAPMQQKIQQGITSFYNQVTGSGNPNQ